MARFLEERSASRSVAAIAAAWSQGIGLLVLAVAIVASTPHSALAQTAPVIIRWWQHPADSEGVRAVWTEVARRFEKTNPGVKVEFTWYHKKDMWPAIRSAFQAGEGPDLFYYDDDVPEFITGGLLADLSDGVNWTNVEPWAKQHWTRSGPRGKVGVWALPVDASTDELYYNKKLLRELGLSVPSNLQFDDNTFAEVVKKCVAAGKSGFAVGVGDRPYPGTYITNYLLLHKLGEQDLRDLWAGGGRVTWNDPRVQEMLAYHKSLIDMKAYPASISSLRLGEAHRYFHTEQRACFMPVGSWYTFRAFQPVEAGGQPKDFELGMLNYPAVRDGKGNDLKFLTIAHSLAVNARSKHINVVKAILNSAADPDVGALWTSKMVSRSTIKTDTAKIQSEYGWYFKMYEEANRLAKPVVLPWQPVMKAGMSDAYTQVMNSAFPAGLISVAEATKKLEEARSRGR
ncbi:MAG: carbohydrate ABC transporter substrate-binding protein [Candidatus Rokubacteria bacterium]|nr:carbohydrate ABC transporter substrate-binding protein [Candidatus Rokubacteria bacterium]